MAQGVRPSEDQVRRDVEEKGESFTPEPSERREVGGLQHDVSPHPAHPPDPWESPEPLSVDCWCHFRHTVYFHRFTQEFSFISPAAHFSPRCRALFKDPSAPRAIIVSERVSLNICGPSGRLNCIWKALQKKQKNLMRGSKQENAVVYLFDDKTLQLWFLSASLPADWAWISILSWEIRPISLLGRDNFWAGSSGAALCWSAGPAEHTWAVSAVISFDRGI